METVVVLLSRVLLRSDRVERFSLNVEKVTAEGGGSQNSYNYLLSRRITLWFGFVL